ncbi:hypothetical protein Dimus_036547, partial [Dionaea muscipula]
PIFDSMHDRVNGDSELSSWLEEETLANTEAYGHLPQVLKLNNNGEIEEDEDSNRVSTMEASTGREAKAGSRARSRARSWA